MQEQIKKEKDYWKQVLIRILSLVKTLAKNNLAFRGDVDKIGEAHNASTKRRQVYQEKVGGLTVKALSDTRWESHIEAIRAIRFQSPKIQEALLYLSESSEFTAETRAEASSLLEYEFKNFEFVLGMIVWHHLMLVVNSVSKLLQNKDMHLDTAVKRFKDLVSFIDNYRNTGFENSLIEAKAVAATMGIEPHFPEKRIIKRTRHFDDESAPEEAPPSGKDSFEVNYFNYILDQAISSLTSRFEQFREFAEIFGFLYNVDQLRSLDDNILLDSCINLENHLKHGMSSDINGHDLYAELKLLKSYLPAETGKTIDVLNFLKDMEGCYPNAFIAYLLTISVTVASAERSFSKLKLIKNYLRSTMSQERLNGLAMLSIEIGMLDNIDFESILEDFASERAGRSAFIMR
ncbi:uncharacterized protein LOC113321002 [Papaver somniferum]|uniref:uncharacterized protein LOC113321002 n=1 Tax=Papaver somniferum TaxID=3469 RepID=UPI000E702E88|nr:uncharacterized protein LOC113321002 [Papaver somniferum]